MKLQASRSPDAKNLQSQIRSGAQNRLLLNGLGNSSRMTDYSRVIVGRSERLRGVPTT